MKSVSTLICVVLSVTAITTLCASAQHNPRVLLDTTHGEIVLELFYRDAPATVDNFLGYVNEGFYDSLLFHRIIYGFMVQGGGYYVSGNTIYYYPPGAPIINESDNGLANLRGTVAMARSDHPDSATSQFFINHVTNPFLDRANAADGVGYCVFGQVAAGMDVVDTIAQNPTVDIDPLDPFDPFNDFPYPLVVMESLSVLPCDQPACSDLNSDTMIDLQDLAAFASYWLDADCSASNDFCREADLDYSGTCNFADFTIFAENWRKPLSD